MEIIKFDEIRQTWNKVAGDNTNAALSFELEVHKKLLNTFHAGDYYYYIFNCATAQIEYTSELVTKVLGFDHADELTTEYLVNQMHPEDRPYFYDFEAKVVSFLLTLPHDKVLKYKMSYDYRVKRKDGRYIRLLQQSTAIQSDEQGAVIRTLGVHTDITHLNKTTAPSLSFVGLDGEPSHYDIGHRNAGNLYQKTVFTKREQQILAQLLEGKTSHQIAEELLISKFTVDQHRKNMLKKTNSRSTIELTMKAIQEAF